jgi:hypothetical protein
MEFKGVAKLKRMFSLRLLENPKLEPDTASFLV